MTSSSNEYTNLSGMIGPHAMWGFTPAQNLLLSKVSKASRDYEQDERFYDKQAQRPIVNVLLANPGDVRHILRTMAAAVRAKRDEGEGTGSRLKKISPKIHVSLFLLFISFNHVNVFVKYGHTITFTT